jgi:hypothetical protein
MTNLNQSKSKVLLKFEKAETELKIFTAKDVTYHMLLGVDWCSNVGAITS